MKSDDSETKSQSGVSNLTAKRFKRKENHKAIEQNLDVINELYEVNDQRQASINFEQPLEGWAALAKTFIFHISTKHRKHFIKKVRLTKLEAERKMKDEIDDRILNMREARLQEALGKDIARLVKIFIKARRYDE